MDISLWYYLLFHAITSVLSYGRANASFYEIDESLNIEGSYDILIRAGILFLAVTGWLGLIVGVWTKLEDKELYWFKFKRYANRNS